jgi:hypothetical protein
MCEKCDEIEKKIVRYQDIRRQIADQFTVDQIIRLIAEMQAQKAALHPE